MPRKVRNGQNSDAVDFFQPNKTLMSSPDVCPSLLKWAEYLLTPAMETPGQKKDRQQKFGEKPMKSYNMTHTKIISRPQRENTADVVTTSSDALKNVGTTTVEAMPKVVNMSSEALAEAMTSSNASADEDPTTKNTSNVLLLYRVGKALQALKRSIEVI